MSLGREHAADSPSVDLVLRVLGRAGKSASATRRRQKSWCARESGSDSSRGLMWRKVLLQT
jgi:hypothetical protein